MQTQLTMKRTKQAACFRVPRYPNSKTPKALAAVGSLVEYPRCQELIRKLMGAPPRKLRAAKPDELTEEQESKVYHQLQPRRVQQLTTHLTLSYILDLRGIYRIMPRSIAKRL